MDTPITGLRVAFAYNDPRYRQLESALRDRVSSLGVINYEPVSSVHRYLAAALTYHSVRKIWWTKYQWHRLMQSGRRKRLLETMATSGIQYDILLMHGSWFNPFQSSAIGPSFYVYIDQSCNKAADENDIQSVALDHARSRFNASQFVTYQKCKAVFCFSDWARRQTLAAHDISEKKVIKVGWGPVGVNLLDEPVRINREEPYVLFVGHEFHRKGVDLLRKAIPEVVREFPNVRFKVVGDNSDHLDVEPHPNLDILGRVGGIEKMSELYRNASIFVLPHRFDRSPHVLVEAMSAGRPIITSDQGGAPEVVHHGRNGFVIPVGDTEALSKYMLTLLGNEEMRLSFGEESRTIMREGYTWEAVASRMLDVICENEGAASP